MLLPDILADPSLFMPACLAFSQAVNKGHETHAYQRNGESVFRLLNHRYQGDIADLEKRRGNSAPDQGAL